MKLPRHTCPVSQICLELVYIYIYVLGVREIREPMRLYRPTYSTDNTTSKNNPNYAYFGNPCHQHRNRERFHFQIPKTMMLDLPTNILPPIPFQDIRYLKNIWQVYTIIEKFLINQKIVLYIQTWKNGALLIDFLIQLLKFRVTAFSVHY